MKPFIPCVLCGGSGARLWPLSRSAMPKPFVALPGRDKTLMDETYARLADSSPTAVITITAAEYIYFCEDSFARYGPSVPHIIIAEPCGRNTAAAIGVATALAAEQFGEEAILAFLPADHSIANGGVFLQALQSAKTAAEGGALALIGVQPTYPATGYGYIECGEETTAGVFAVRRFLEKPDLPTATDFVKSGGMLWNAGIFCFTVKVGLRELHQHAADVANALPILKENNGRVTPSLEEYQKIPSISYDYAVAEKTSAAVVVAADAKLGWNDIGSWRSLADTLPPDAAGNRIVGDVCLSDCTDTFVTGSGRLIAAIGLDGVHIIDTPDALLVANANQTEQVREIVQALGERPETQAPATMRKPWGSYQVLSERQGYKIKRIDVVPGGRLSLQSHKHRSEHWTTISGVMTIVIDEKEFKLPVDKSCYIPSGAKHRMSNNTDKPAALIEVQIGDYLEEDDIIRYEDIYGRA